MNTLRNLLITVAMSVLVSNCLQAANAPRTALPDALVDLRTGEGVTLLQAKWRYHDIEIASVRHRDVGSDLKATGKRNITYDFSPDAKGADYDDSRWEEIEPASLEARRGHGRLSLNWYRINVVIPEKVAAFATLGSTAVFEIVMDDYAEVWVNGQLNQVLGQQGGAVVAGWNAPNRVILGRDVRPGDRFQIAVLGINGPLSTHPDTYIWVRSATIEFYQPGKLNKARTVNLEVDRRDPALAAIVPMDARLEKMADGFAFTEGPVWVSDGEGYLLFSDPNNNLIHRMTRDGEVSVYRPKSGYTGMDIGEYGQPGSNGLTLDEQGRLTICEHGNRRVTRLEKNGLITVLADRFEGHRLNSPNDLVYRGDGTLFFTDPPFGLPRFHKDPRREIPYPGVYSVRNGQVQLVNSECSGPNGLAFSPDEKYLYVGNWDEKRKVVLRCPCHPDGTLGNGEVFYDMTSAPGEDAIDGIKVDGSGNVYVSGPGGLWILSPEGKHLGTLRGPEHPHNMAWGEADRHTLFWAAQTAIYRIRLSVSGAGSVEKKMSLAVR